MTVNLKTTRIKDSWLASISPSQATFLYLPGPVPVVGPVRARLHVHDHHQDESPHYAHRPDPQRAHDDLVQRAGAQGLHPQKRVQGSYPGAGRRSSRALESQNETLHQPEQTRQEVHAKEEEKHRSNPLRFTRSAIGRCSKSHRRAWGPFSKKNQMSTQKEKNKTKKTTTTTTKKIRKESKRCTNYDSGAASRLHTGGRLVCPPGADLVTGSV